MLKDGVDVYFSEMLCMKASISEGVPLALLLGSSWREESNKFPYTEQSKSNVRFQERLRGVNCALFESPLSGFIT